jgi:hypothetical protein
VRRTVTGVEREVMRPWLVFLGPSGEKREKTGAICLAPQWDTITGQD